MAASVHVCTVRHVKAPHSSDVPCVALVLPESLLRLGVAAALSRLGMVLHQSASFDPLSCTPRLLIVEPSHLPECALLYPETPAMTVSLFDSAVAATPATSPEDMLARVRKLLAPAPALRQLSPQEHQVLTLIASGHSTEQVARECFISKETVKTHLARIYRKLGATNRASAITIANRQGMLVS